MTELHNEKNRLIENIIDDVSTLILHYSDVSPEDAQIMLEDFNEFWDAPYDGGDIIYKEAKTDIELIISKISDKNQLNEEEYLLLQEASSLLNEIEFKMAYNENNNRVLAKHTIAFNIEHLRAITTDKNYQNCLDFAENKIKNLFENKFGMLSGTNVFHNTFDVLISFYFYVELMDNLTTTDKHTVAELIFDIAQNISPAASAYLAKKATVFAELSNSTN